jgi:hypothetical protein
LSVTVRSNGTTYQFRDSLILPQNNDGTYSPITAFIAPSFAVQPGKSYQLIVSAPGFETATASTLTPGTADLSLFNTPVLNQPDRFSSSFFVRVTLSGSAKGFVLHPMIEYEIFENNAWNPMRIEIPLAHGFGGVGWNEQVFAQFGLVTVRNLEFAFLHSLYVETLREVLLRRHPAKSVTFKRVVLELTQSDEHSYDYFSIANGFRDDLSIRSDAPDYSNISRGFGLFGAYTIDRLVHTLPEGFSYNR